MQSGASRRCRRRSCRRFLPPHEWAKLTGEASELNKAVFTAHFGPADCLCYLATAGIGFCCCAQCFGVQAKQRAKTSIEYRSVAAGLWRRRQRLRRWVWRKRQRCPSLGMMMRGRRSSPGSGLSELLSPSVKGRLRFGWRCSSWTSCCRNFRTRDLTYTLETSGTSLSCGVCLFLSRQAF